MIGFNLLGNLGRIGNQMFQYAALKGISKNMGYDYYIPSKDYFGTMDPLVKQSDLNIHDCFNITKKYGIINGENSQESSFHFDENIFNKCKDNTTLCGYFQSEKYFQNVEDELRKEFVFNEEVVSLGTQFLSQIECSDAISLHVRRGDYLKYSHHPTQSLEYYEQALTYFDNDLPVIIFSDDTEWVKKQNLFSSDRFFISENNGTEFDLCLMSLCTYAIITNSSFSWWGSWLANNKKTIAPKKWFGPPLTHDTKDLYRKNWIVI